MGLYWDNGKENGNYYIGLYRGFMGGVQDLGFRVWGRLGFYGHSRDIDPRNQRALTLLDLLLECSSILFILVQNPNLVWGVGLRD